MLDGVGLRDTGQQRVAPAFGDFLGNPFKDVLAVFGEAERDVRLARAAVAFVEPLDRVGDVGPVEHRHVLQGVPAVRGFDDLLAFGVFDGARLDEHGARRDTHRLDHGTLGRRVAGVQRLFGFRALAVGLATGAQDLFVLGFDQVPRAVEAGPLGALFLGAARGPGRRRRVQFDWPLEGTLDRVVLADARRGGPGIRAAGDRRFGRLRLAFGADHVRLPVIELQLRGLADLVLGARGVADVRERDGDFFFAGELDFGLRDPELVDALAHDFHGPLERFAVDLRLRRRLALIDQLDAAAQVEAELRRLRDDHDQRGHEESRDDEQDQEVFTAVGHRAGEPTWPASGRAAARPRRLRRRRGRCLRSRRPGGHGGRRPGREPQVRARPTQVPVRSGRPHPRT